MSSICSAELADSVLDSREQECELSPSARSIPIAEQSLKSIGQTFPALKMSERSQQQMFPESMSSAADSHARTSVPPAQARGWMEAAVACGVNTRELLASYDHSMSSWRTSQLCLSGEWDEFSETWPESGMTQSGRLFRLAPWVPHTCDDECSLWPTPTASMDGRGFGIPLNERAGRYKKATVCRVHALVGEHGWRIHPNFTEGLMNFPPDWTAIEELETPSTLT